MGITTGDTGPPWLVLQHTQLISNLGTARASRLVRLSGYGEFRVVTRTPPEEFNVNDVAELAALD